MDITDWLKIPDNNLEQEIRQHSSRLYYIGRRLSESQSEAHTLERLLDYQKSVIREELRIRGKKHGSHLTESRLEDKVKLDPRYVEKQKLLEKKNSQVESLKILYKTILIKGDMLTNLTHMRQKEMSFQIKQQVAKSTHKIKE